jgi:hypothetical protein
MNGNSRIRILVTKVTYARDTPEENRSLKGRM